MTSSIDPTYPVSGNPTTLSVRDNFLAAKNEIEALQSDMTTAQGDITTLQTKTNYATTTVAGIIELATQAEADGGTNSSSAMTPETSYKALLPRKAELHGHLGNRTVVADDLGKLHHMNAQFGDITFTLPTVATLGEGFQFQATNYGANDLVFTSTANINGSSSNLTISSKYSIVTVVAIPSGWVVYPSA